MGEMNQPSILTAKTMSQIPTNGSLLRTMSLPQFPSEERTFPRTISMPQLPVNLQKIFPVANFNAVMRMKGHYRAWVSALTEEERTAITTYTGTGGFQEVNSTLRSGTSANSLPQGTRLLIEQLRSGLEKAPPTMEPLKIFRTTTKEALGEYSLLPLGELVGKVITDNAFMSTSLYENKATISNDPERLLNNNVMLAINVPPGTSGIGFLEGITSIPGECELLFNCGGIRMAIMEAREVPIPRSLWPEDCQGLNRLQLECFLLGK